MQENFAVINEIQNMRFMLQDKESYIQRLEFVIERDRKERIEAGIDAKSASKSRPRIEAKDNMSPVSPQMAAPSASK